ncbi:MAG TPA: glycine--tRNA ligase subunit beta [Acidobacteriota bacterium]|nr:glycine--tRNA ligase subunit beta [Acidobacteriota bacterium]
METSELIVELGVEEIPAWMLDSAARQFADKLVQGLKDQRLSSQLESIWYTPRRLIVSLKSLPVRQDDLVEVVLGPPKSVAYDSDGKPTRAAQAFAQKNGVPLSGVKTVQTPKGEYLSLEKKTKGEDTRKLLARLIPSAVAGIQFPKTMHWTADQFRFARPLRWILALFRGRVVRFRIADVSSSNVSVGHRFLGKHRIAVGSGADLQRLLRENGVLADPLERRRRIEEGLKREADACGGSLVEDPSLLETVTNLNEYPSVILGSFEVRFLELPKEILITVMREHQKYFSLLDSSGTLLPAFLAVINLDADHGGLIRAGHERVLRARLADAAFFWSTDLKRSLLEREESLKHVLFQEKLGSYFDKTRRVLSLLPRLARKLDRADLLADLEAAGRIFKCDLVTEMVKEFTDLQGVVGGLYAQAEGYGEPVWRAIYEQYLPKSTNSGSPDTVTGAILSLADRLDTVCGCFSVGLIPSGSRDPLAVRRQGNGLLKIILDHRMSLALGELIDWGLEAHGMPSEKTAGELREFLGGRLRFLFEEMGYSYDCIKAVMAVGFDDPHDTLVRLRALQAMREETDFLSLASNFKRIANILEQAGDIRGVPEESKMVEPSELALWREYLRVCPEVESARVKHDYSAALRSLASMRGVVDDFFDKVLVMAQDTGVRANRLSLLRELSSLFLGVADISQIVLERGN